jgi:sarcosine oxidase, subunit delta
MLLIHCPWCGPRTQNEFTCGGEIDTARPLDPRSGWNGEWSNYLFFRKNVRGVQRERWCHSLGCRRWFQAIRHTVCDTFWATFKIGEVPPTPPHEWSGEPPNLVPAANADNTTPRVDSPKPTDECL